MWDGINRRQFPRVHYRCRIYIRKKDGARTISTHTENVGTGGICVILNEDLGLFHGVNLELELENGITSNIICSGTIVWVVKKHDVTTKGATSYDIGIEFVDINEEEKSRVSKVVEELLKK